MNILNHTKLALNSHQSVVQALNRLQRRGAHSGDALLLISFFDGIAGASAGGGAAMDIGSRDGSKNTLFMDLSQ